MYIHSESLIYSLLNVAKSCAGIDGRTEATGLGVYYGVRELLGYEAKTKTFGFSKTGMADQRVIVQGFGNGAYLVMCFNQLIHSNSFKLTSFQSPILDLTSSD